MNIIYYRKADYGEYREHQNSLSLEGFCGFLSTQSLFYHQQASGLNQVTIRGHLCGE